MPTLAPAREFDARPRHSALLARPAPYLEYLSHTSNRVQRVSLDTLPFRLGRTPNANFVIPHGQISRLHSEIYQCGDEFHIRDLQSTNGTFLNGHRTEDARLTHGDILQLSHHEFRFLLRDLTEPVEYLEQTDLLLGSLPTSVLLNLPHLKDLLARRLVRTFFQPICRLDSGTPVGYEALGRGKHPNLSARPVDLLELAEQCQLAPELSRLFRGVAIQEALALQGRPALFMNTHPTEVKDASLPEALSRLREVLPAVQPLILEIHEDAVADLPVLRRLRQELRERDIGLAYDDFGVGQSRLHELTEVPPDFVKLDMKVIRNLHDSKPRQGLVRAIAQVSQDLGIQVVAEGIETEDEANICQELGCTLGQGYLLGHPEAAPVPLVDLETWRIDRATAAASQAS